MLRSAHPCGCYLGAGRRLHLRVAGRQVGDAAEKAEHAQGVTRCDGASERRTHWLPSALPALGAGLEHLKGEGTMFLALQGALVSIVNEIYTPKGPPMP